MARNKRTKSPICRRKLRVAGLEWLLAKDAVVMVAQSIAARIISKPIGSTMRCSIMDQFR